jgi:hypothetical protein
MKNFLAIYQLEGNRMCVFYWNRHFF